MKARRFWLLALLIAAPLLCGCDDSKNPLSDLKMSQPDDRLLGLWRVQDDKSATAEYYHVGHVPDAPAGVMRVIGVSHNKNGKIDLEDFLMFVTTLGDKTYLNVTGGGNETIKRLKENGWQPADEATYFLFKYQVDGDAIAVRGMETDVKRQAIEAGMIKGETGAQTAKFTDTSENVARFVSEAGDGLFVKEAGRLERVK
jgi:hypothetical protein